MKSNKKFYNKLGSMGIRTENDQFGTQNIYIMRFKDSNHCFLRGWIKIHIYPTPKLREYNSYTNIFVEEDDL
jgi:hypothetical protein